MKYNNLFDIWKTSAEIYPERIALTDVSRQTKISFKIAFKEICCIAEFFNNKNITEGDKVCIFAENFPHWLLLEQASICLGAISVTNNSQNSITELEYIYQENEFTALICDNPDIINEFIEKYPDFLNRNKMILYTGYDDQYRNNEKITYLSDILKDFSPDKEYFSDFENKPDDLCHIDYIQKTSLSQSNKNIVDKLEELNKKFKDYSPKSFISCFPLTETDEKYLNLSAISLGCTIYCVPYSRYFEQIEKILPDMLHCTPEIMKTMYDKFMNYISSQGKNFEKIFNFNFELVLKIIRAQNYFYSKRKINIKPTGLNGLFERVFIFIRKIQYNLIFKQIKNTLLQDDTLIFLNSTSLTMLEEEFYNTIDVNIIKTDNIA